MFDIDDDYLDNAERTVIRFSYETFDAHHNRVARVERIIRNEDAEYLPSILEAFMYFLQGMTFTYIDNVVAVHESGKETSAMEV